MYITRINKCFTSSKHGHKYSRNIKFINVIRYIVVFPCIYKDVCNVFPRNSPSHICMGVQNTLKLFEFDAIFDIQRKESDIDRTRPPPPTQIQYKPRAWALHIRTIDQSTAHILIKLGIGIIIIAEKTKHSKQIEYLQTLWAMFQNF